MTRAEKQSYTDRLQGYTVADWQPLFTLIPQFEQANSDREDDLLSRFVQTVYDRPDIVLVFDWMNWKKGKTVLHNSQPDFDKYNLLTLCMFVTTIVRADRFSDGFLSYCHRKGVVLDLLKAIKKRVEEPKGVM